MRLVKIPVLLRMARAMQRSEARDWLAVAALAQTQSERQRSASVSNRFGSQAVWNKSNRCAGARGGARVGRPRWLRILTITGGSSIAALRRRLRTGDDLQSAAAVRAVVDVNIEDSFEQPCQLMRAGAPCACASSVEASVARSAGLGMILPRNFALGTSMPWKRIRCKRERGTSAASRCMNSSGAMTIWVVPSLNALFNATRHRRRDYAVMLGCVGFSYDARVTERLTPSGVTVPIAKNCPACSVSSEFLTVKSSNGPVNPNREFTLS